MGFRQNISKDEDVLTFGKYKGKSVGEVILENAQYILWLADEKIIVLDKVYQDRVLINAQEQYSAKMRIHHSTYGLDVDDIPY